MLLLSLYLELYLVAITIIIRIKLVYMDILSIKGKKFPWVLFHHHIVLLKCVGNLLVFSPLLFPLSNHFLEQLLSLSPCKVSLEESLD